MEVKKMIPIGVENFEKLRQNDYYYVDKTGLIRDLLQNRADVTLFTRPRRFGKSLNMSMLGRFFSVDGDKSIFDGLEITKETGLCEKHMGKYPVISLSLKGIDRPTYEKAFQRAADVILETAENFQFLLDSENLNEHEKARYQQLLDVNMSERTLIGGLKLLSKLLAKHYGTKAIILIDEYDVPLQKAFVNGYYDQMISLIRGLLSDALKTNDNLEFAVLTGCLRVAKESIFTGMNNLKVFSVTDAPFSEYFGFTGQEVRKILDYYELGNRYETVQEWYDGYRFGYEDIYCPWDVINYCDDIRRDPRISPRNYWINTSGNDVIKRFVAMASDSTREEIERLIAGEAIEKEIRLDLTYSEMYDSIENLWSLLFMTGYLTQQGEADGRKRKLTIPNQEVRDVFVMQIQEYFKESVRSDTDTLDAFCSALVKGDVDEVRKCFIRYLRRTISVRDTMAKEEQKENFYHGVLLGILLAKEGWDVKSNRESGDGYADVLVVPEHGDLGIGIVIELKYDKDLDQGCKDALSQIEKKRYAEGLQNEGMETILKYGISCYKKTCQVVLGESLEIDVK